jgi:hypothetical protein
MKHAIIGTALISYSLFLCPAIIEPSDLIISPAWIAVAMAANIPVVIIWLWIISGYIALIAGSVLLGHSILKRIPAITSSIKNPIALVLLIVFIVSVVCFVVLGVI